MCAALDGTRFQRTGGDSSKSDGFIVLKVGAEIEVEVARDLSESFMRSAAEAEKKNAPIELRPASGSWFVYFHSDTRIKDLEKKAQGLVDDVMSSKQIRTPELRAAFDYTFDGLRVGIIQRMGDVPDQLAFGFMEISNPDNSFFSTSPDGIGDYAQDYISGAGSPSSSAHRGSKFENLARRANENNRQAHFAVVASSPKNPGVWHALSGLQLGATWDFDLPRRNLEMPEGVHGFWIIMPDCLNTVAYLDDRGWIRFPG
jgi:hypothetical protein